ncbi:hypothetical protein DF196_02940 [Bifidobacterium callitrichidarum]|uniref:DUF559 domain-containing protein n=2 Tax=Bifidobacterium callitrichidarum TaxID=2052941 RepID=A0A2U2NC56_9BIFI|nr:hypothetical protein DF196_02940 [Bifidobacterium callitrichidarum]
MRDDLAQRKRDTLKRCTEEAKRLGRQLLFGMITALTLQSVPLPADCDLDAEVLHTVSSTKAKRIRVRNSPLRAHTWKAVSVAGRVRMNQHVFAIDLFHAWAQLAVHVPLLSLIALGDSIITATAQQPSLAKGRDASDIHRDFAVFVDGLASFNGKTACVRAAALVMPNVDSPKETECRLALQRHGIPCPVVNYTIPGMSFKSGVSMTLDMAWPEYRVGVEYDGDQHRTDKAQWRRDQGKRDRLRVRGWMIFSVTAANLVDDSARSELAFSVARQLAIRGMEFDFRVVAMTVEQLAATQRR